MGEGWGVASRTRAAGQLPLPAADSVTSVPGVPITWLSTFPLPTNSDMVRAWEKSPGREVTYSGGTIPSFSLHITSFKNKRLVDVIPFWSPLCRSRSPKVWQIGVMVKISTSSEILICQGFTAIFPPLGECPL